MTTAPSPPLVRYIFRCPAGHSWTRDYENTPPMSQGEPMGIFPIAHRMEGDRIIYPNNAKERVCPECGGFADYRKPVKATGTDAPCGQSCKEAVGAECRCSCLSANHGASLLRKEIERGQEFLAARFILPRPGIDNKSTTWGSLR